MVEPTEINETVDLSDLLATATAEKIVIAVPETQTETTIEDQAKFAGDYDETILNEAAEEEASQTTEETVKEALFDNETLAPAIIDIVDITQQKTLPIAYERTLDESDRIAMKLFLRKFKAGTMEKTLTQDGERIVEIMNDYQTYIDSLPFTKEEKKSILTPLKKVLAKVDVQMSPEKALLIACVAPFIARATPLAKNYFFSDKKEEESK